MNDTTTQQAAIIDAFFASDIDGNHWVCAHCASLYPSNYTHLLYIPANERYDAFCGICYAAIDHAD